MYTTSSKALFTQLGASLNAFTPFLANSFWHLLALRYINKTLGWEGTCCS